MPTLEEYRRFHSQAIKDAEAFRWYGRMHPDRRYLYDQLAYEAELRSKNG